MDAGINGDFNHVNSKVLSNLLSTFPKMLYREAVNIFVISAKGVKLLFRGF